MDNYPKLKQAGNATLSKVPESKRLRSGEVRDPETKEILQKAEYDIIPARVVLSVPAIADDGSVTTKEHPVDEGRLRAELTRIASQIEALNAQKASHELMLADIAALEEEQPE